MKKLPILLALSLGLLAVNPASAVVSLAFGDTLGDPSEATVASGDSFSITLTLTSTAELTSALSYFLAVDGAGSGGFRITGLDVTGSGFADLVTGTGISLSSSDALLDPTNTFDLGGLADPAPNGAGSFLVAALTLQALPGLAPGVYTIRTDSAFALDDSFGTLPVNQPTYTVNVVPEAHTAALLGIVVLGGLVRRRK